MLSEPLPLFGNVLVGKGKTQGPGTGTYLAVTCGCPFPHPTTGVSVQSDDDDALRRRCMAELRSQGLDVPIRDPTVLADIAARLGAVDANARAKRIAALRQELLNQHVTIPLLEPEEL